MLLTIVILVGIIWVACKGKATQEYINYTSNTEEYDPNRGEGKFESVTLGPINAKKAKKGHAIYDVKCHSCHKLTDEKLVAPGWKGVTERHAPEWILNFITDPDPMIDKDPKLLAMMELCLIRMPNQNISDDEAFAVLEFMRKNDDKNK